MGALSGNYFLEKILEVEKSFYKPNKTDEKNSLDEPTEMSEEL